LNEKVRLIYNPAAGKGKAEKIFPNVQTLLAERFFEYDLHFTEKAEHARELAYQAAEEGCSLVVAAGGDGTINETINGLMSPELNGKSRPALGVLPIGRGNDFAFGVKIPLDLKDSVDVLVRGHRRTIDIGCVTGGDYPEGRYFGNGVGLGFDTVVGFEANKLTWVSGAASYLIALVRTIFLYSKAPVYEIIIDDGKAFQRGFLMVSVMNGSRMGGSFHMAPDGNPGDGAFDLCLANYVPQIKILPLAAKFLNGSQKGHSAIKMMQGKKIFIRAIEGTIPAHADGETICVAGHNLSIEMYPNALEVISHHEL
jgi:YegS/Rv2252/BmrU family lipid kinase